MKTWLLLLACLLALASQAQSRREVYEWKDADGVTHFSDYPQPGARKIILNGSSSTTPAPQVAATVPKAPAPQPEVQYDRLDILTPMADESFFEPDTEIVVRIRPEPDLDAADRLATYVDGKLLPDLNALEHRLTDLARGAHTVTSVIYGRDGKEKINSSIVTFHMKQTTAVNPRNQGTAVRPKPRPTPR